MRPPLVGVVPALVLALPCVARAQSLVRSVNGPAANAQYGRACVVVPDQNGDGFKDVLVGAPGFNSQRGAIFCLSGAYLATGTGTQTLWSLAPTANQGDLFGAAIADMGDMTGDGLHDFLVGQPGYDDGVDQDAGAVRLVHGASHALLSLHHGQGQSGLFGSAIASLGDANGDGISEVVIGAPGPNSFQSYFVVQTNGANLLASGPALSFPGILAYGSSGPSRLGFAVAGGFDLDGDGYPDFAVGAPGGSGATGPNFSGVVFLGSAAPGNSWLGFCDGATAGEEFGASLCAGSDYDGDGVTDLVVGAPNAPDTLGLEAGRVVVLSGAKLAAQTPPYEIRHPTLGFSSTFFDYHFGAAVSAGSDLNGDGVGEILVGTPGYATLGGGGQISHKGLLTIFSGATGVAWSSIAGGSTDRFGDAIAGALADLDGNGFKEFVAAGSQSDAGGTDSGVVKCYQLFPLAPASYCTGKPNSLGCTPAIGSSGTPSESSTAAFQITANDFLNQKTGLLFYSHAPAAALFQGGTKCVANPTLRTPPQSSAGAPSGASCSGTYALDFNAWIQSGADASLVAGSEVFAQYWSRDPVSASHTSLSNALRFLIHP